VAHQPHEVGHLLTNLPPTSLTGGNARVDDLAGRLGYRSEAAFSRAFKRLVGLSPGGVRVTFRGAGGSFS
jgi:AraC-like DNA-binding protein